MESLDSELNKLAAEYPSVAAVLTSPNTGGGSGAFSASSLLFAGLCISALATAILVSCSTELPQKEEKDKEKSRCCPWDRVAAWTTVVLLAAFGIIMFVVG